MADDLEVAEVLGARIAAPALGLEPAKMAVVKKWAKLKSVGKRHLAVLAATGLVTDGHREATAVLTLAEALLDEQNPVMIGAVAQAAPGDDARGREGGAGLPVPPLDRRQSGHPPGRAPRTSTPRGARRSSRSSKRRPPSPRRSRRPSARVRPFFPRSLSLPDTAGHASPAKATSGRTSELKAAGQNRGPSAISRQVELLVEPEAEHGEVQERDERRPRARRPR